MLRKLVGTSLRKISIGKVDSSVRKQLSIASLWTPRNLADDKKPSRTRPNDRQLKFKKQDNRALNIEG